MDESPDGQQSESGATPTPPASKTWIEDTTEMLTRQITGILGSLTAESPDVDDFSQRAPVGFSYSPAGLLLPYHLGVTRYLQDTGFLDERVPIAGASAGALCTVLAGCKLDVAEVGLFALYEVERNIEKLGAAGRLMDVLRTHFMNLVQTEHISVFNARPAPATVSYTSLTPYPRGRFVSQFASTADLLDVLCASCNIPFYFAAWPTVRCRGRPAVDGYFAVPRAHFGCPPTGARKDIFVVPFPATRVKLKHTLGDAISPDLSKCDQRLTEDQVDGFLRYLEARPVARYEDLKRRFSSASGTSHCEDGDETHGTSARIMQYLAPLEHPLLTMTDEGTDQRDRRQLANPRLPTLNLTISDLLKYALDYAPDDVIHHLFDVGRADAFRWHQLQLRDSIEERRLGYPRAPRVSLRREATRRSRRS